MAKVGTTVIELLKRKASHSPCTYKISGIAYSEKGNVLGIATNSHSKWNVLSKIPIGRSGTSEHCEKLLIKKFRNKIKTIVICRIGRSGKTLPISPCQSCSKLAEKYGIMIISVPPSM
jgi:hypothetical protein